MKAFRRLGGDVVLKPLFGSEGRGMARLSDAGLAGRAFHALERQGAVIYQQQFIPHPGWDLRVFVLGGEVLAAMRRSAAPIFSAAGEAEWRTNIARGGRGEPVDLPAEAADLALRAARGVGTEIAGVDLLPDRRGGYWVLEVNSAPGWKALAQVTGTDVAARVLLYLQGRDRGDGDGRPG
jgi:ribosomal protein S6--L-glutamate ligase